MSNKEVNKITLILSILVTLILLSFGGVYAIEKRTPDGSVVTDTVGKSQKTGEDKIKVDTIEEKTSGNGVSIDGVTLKDGKVGIGTTNPSYKFHLYGSEASNFLAKIEAATAYGLSIKTVGTTTSHDVLKLEDNSGTVFGVYGTGLTYIKGNVGINNSNPLYSLDVNGTANVTGALSFPTTSLSDVQATRMGLKMYRCDKSGGANDTAYNGGNKATVAAVSGATLNSVAGCKLFPYQLQDGTWALKIGMQLSTSGTNDMTLSINGFISSSGFGNQACALSQQTGFTQRVSSCHTGVGTAVIAIVFTEGVSIFSFNGDFILNSKPTWAY